MNALTTQPEGPALTERQAKFVKALLEGTDEASALELAGYSETVSVAEVLRSGAVQRALSIGIDAKMSGPMKLKAMRAIDQMLDGGNATVRFQAAKLVLDWGAEDAGHGRPLSELTIEELEQIVRQKEAELKRVTPDNGASS